MRQMKQPLPEIGRPGPQLRARAVLMDPADVRALREELNLDPLQLAQRLGVDPRLVLQWEAGDRFPTKKHCTMMDGLRSSHSVVPRQAEPTPVPSNDPSSALVAWLLAEPAFQQRLGQLVRDYLSSSSSAGHLPSPASSHGSSEEVGSAPSAASADGDSSSTNSSESGAALDQASSSSSFRPSD